MPTCRRLSFERSVCRVPPEMKRTAGSCPSCCLSAVLLARGSARHHELQPLLRFESHHVADNRLPLDSLIGIDELSCLCWLLWCCTVMLIRSGQHTTAVNNRQHVPATPRLQASWTGKGGMSVVSSSWTLTSQRLSKQPCRQAGPTPYLNIAQCRICGPGAL
jgi:hypothetical protein